MGDRLGKRLLAIFLAGLLCLGTLEPARDANASEISGTETQIVQDEVPKATADSLENSDGRTASESDLQEQNDATATPGQVAIPADAVMLKNDLPSARKRQRYYQIIFSFDDKNSAARLPDIDVTVSKEDFSKTVTVSAADNWQTYFTVDRFDDDDYQVTFDVPDGWVLSSSVLNSTVWEDNVLTSVFSLQKKRTSSVDVIWDGMDPSETSQLQTHVSIYSDYSPKFLQLITYDGTYQDTDGNTYRFLDEENPEILHWNLGEIQLSGTPMIVATVPDGWVLNTEDPRYQDITADQYGNYSATLVFSRMPYTVNVIWQGAAPDDTEPLSCDLTITDSDTELSHTVTLTQDNRVSGADFLKYQYQEKYPRFEGSDPYSVSVTPPEGWELLTSSARNEYTDAYYYEPGVRYMPSRTIISGVVRTFVLVRKGADRKTEFHISGKWTTAYYRPNETNYGSIPDPAVYNTVLPDTLEAVLKDHHHPDFSQNITLTTQPDSGETGVFAVLSADTLSLDYVKDADYYLEVSNPSIEWLVDADSLKISLDDNGDYQADVICRIQKAQLYIDVSYNPSSSYKQDGITSNNLHVTGKLEDGTEYDVIYPISTADYGGRMTLYLPLGTYIITLERREEGDPNNHFDEYLIEYSNSVGDKVEKSNQFTINSERLGYSYFDISLSKTPKVILRKRWEGYYYDTTLEKYQASAAGENYDNQLIANTRVYLVDETLGLKNQDALAFNSIRQSEIGDGVVQYEQICRYISNYDSNWNYKRAAIDPTHAYGVVEIGPDGQQITPYRVERTDTENGDIVLTVINKRETPSLIVESLWTGSDGEASDSPSDSYGQAIGTPGQISGSGFSQTDYQTTITVYDKTADPNHQNPLLTYRFAKTDLEKGGTDGELPVYRHVFHSYTKDGVEHLFDSTHEYEVVEQKLDDLHQRQFITTITSSKNDSGDFLFTIQHQFHQVRLTVKATWLWPGDETFDGSAHYRVYDVTDDPDCTTPVIEGTFSDDDIQTQIQNKYLATGEIIYSHDYYLDDQGRPFDSSHEYRVVEDVIAGRENQYAIRYSPMTVDGQGDIQLEIINSRTSSFCFAKVWGDAPVPSFVPVLGAPARQGSQQNARNSEDISDPYNNIPTKVDFRVIEVSNDGTEREVGQVTIPTGFYRGQQNNMMTLSEANTGIQFDPAKYYRLEEIEIPGWKSEEIEPKISYTWIGFSYIEALRNIPVGGLKVTKHVFIADKATDGELGEEWGNAEIDGEPLKEREFNFRVTLYTGEDRNAVDTTVDGDYSGITFHNGVADFTLKDGESITFQDLPYQDWYVVEEQLDADERNQFEMSGLSSVNTDEDVQIIKDENGRPERIEIAGAIKWKKVSEVEVQNTLKTGGFRIAKKVQGENADRTRSFKFRVTLPGNPLSGIYGDLTFEQGEAEIYLKDGEEASVSGLPCGMSYTVEELDLDHYSSSAEIQSGETSEPAVYTAGSVKKILPDVVPKIIFTNTYITENPTPENPTPENPTPENPTPENPTPENPTPENPTSANPGTHSHSSSHDGSGSSDSSHSSVSDYPMKSSGTTETTAAESSLEETESSAQGYVPMSPNRGTTVRRSSARTGDDSHVTVYLILCFISAGLLCVFTVIAHRKKNHQR